MPKKKQPNRRSKVKYPALDKKYNLKTRQDQLEIDYLDKLSDEEKDWLNRFNEEEVNANFNHNGKKLNRTKTQRKACYDRNNSRNRDIFTRAKASGELLELGNIQNTSNELELSSLDAIELVEEFNDLKNSLASGDKGKKAAKKKN